MMIPAAPDQPVMCGVRVEYSSKVIQRTFGVRNIIGQLCTHKVYSTQRKKQTRVRKINAALFEEINIAKKYMHENVWQQNLCVEIM